MMYGQLASVDDGGTTEHLSDQRFGKRLSAKFEPTRGQEREASRKNTNGRCENRTKCPRLEKNAEVSLVLLRKLGWTAQKQQVEGLHPAGFWNGEYTELHETAFRNHLCACPTAKGSVPEIGFDLQVIYDMHLLQVPGRAQERRAR
jgi:hypothetical protein